MNSVLLVGCENFIADVQSQVRGLDSLTVVTAMSMGNAMARLETLTPDVVMIQASVLADFAVLKAFDYV